MLAHCASSPVLKVLDIAVLLSRDHFWCKILIYPAGVNGDTCGVILDCPMLVPNCPQYGPQLPNSQSSFAPCHIVVKHGKLGQLRC